MALLWRCRISASLGLEYPEYRVGLVDQLTRSGWKHPWLVTDWVVGFVKRVPVRVLSCANQFRLDRMLQLCQHERSWPKFTCLESEFVGISSVIVLVRLTGILSCASRPKLLVRVHIPLLNCWIAEVLNLVCSCTVGARARCPRNYQAIKLLAFATRYHRGGTGIAWSSGGVMCYCKDWHLWVKPHMRFNMQSFVLYNAGDLNVQQKMTWNVLYDNPITLNWSLDDVFSPETSRVSWSKHTCQFWASV